MTDSMTANWFASVAILAWPIVAIVLYRTRPFSEATIWNILGALLLLPSNASVKLEMIPAFDKNAIPNFCALVGCILLARRKQTVRYGFGIIEILVVMLVVGPVLTSAYNDDTLIFGNRILPGVGYYDGISALLSQLILFLPFLIGRRYLQRSSDTATILYVLVVAGLWYSLPMLFEIRMSPQLSNWIYGLSASFSTEMRYGGFRPVVFMKNGLAAAFFMATSFLASLALWRVRTSLKRLPPVGVAAYLGIVVILCKSAGALVYGVVVGPIIRWITPKLQLYLAAAIVGIALLYPVLRITDNVPDNTLLETATLFSQERADSLKTRFDQERQLVARANERFLLGWGRYGRNRVYDESGKDVSLTDGGWILALGQFGIVGFIAQFGLLSLPVFRAVSALRFARSVRDRTFLAALALIVALSLIEQIPNASISSWNWLLAGALLGRSEYLRALARDLRSFPDPEKSQMHLAGTGKGDQQTNLSRSLYLS